MPSKSRNTRGKQTHKSRKSKAKERNELLKSRPESPSLAVTPDKKVEPRTIEPVPAPSKTKTMVYPHVTEELKRIGIIAAIIFVVLIILAIVIP